MRIEIKIVPVAIADISSGRVVAEAHCGVMGPPGGPNTVVTSDPAVLFRPAHHPLTGSLDFAGVAGRVERVILTSLHSCTPPPPPDDRWTVRAEDALFDGGVKVRVPRQAVELADTSSVPTWLDHLRDLGELKVIDPGKQYVIGNLLFFHSSDSPTTPSFALLAAEGGGLVLFADERQRLPVQPDWQRIPPYSKRMC